MTARVRCAVMAAACLAAAAPLAAQVRGRVANGTDGGPAGGVALTLSSFLGGMTPVEEVVSGPDGRFAFTKDLPAVSANQPFAGAIRAEFEGIGYTEVLESASLGREVSITVYSVSETNLPQPSNRVVILEPSGGELRVHDGYQFLNDSSPPVTYSSEEGTLRFHLPAEAGGEVKVSGRGPARMPLPSTALPAGEPGLYKVDFPLKPGDNQLDLSYTVPYEDGTEFTLRSTYPGSVTRVGAPQGVDVSGSGVTPLGQEPTTKASLFLISDEPEVTMTITGEGRLTRSSGGTGSGESEISIQPAPVASELAWIIVLATLILGLGYFHLLKSRLPGGSEDPRRKRT